MMKLNSFDRNGSIWVNERCTRIYKEEDAQKKRDKSRLKPILKAFLEEAPSELRDNVVCGGMSS